MSLKVGVVCEGSHDFNVLSPFIDQIIRESGETVEIIECLQPEVSATFQVSSGGWHQVRSWCRLANGQGYRKHLDKPLFFTSKSYDILVIQLDGDVVEHCDSAPLDTLTIQGMDIPDVVSAIQDAILNHWLDLVEDHRNRVVPCVPVRHLEAWLSAALGPKVANHENLDMKGIFRAGPVAALPGSWRNRYIKAAKQALLKAPDIRAACISFRTFETNLRAATELA